MRPSNSVSDVLNFLSASTTLPADVRLLHAGHHLDPAKKVGELNLEPSATLHLLSPLRGGTAKPSSTAQGMTGNLAETAAASTASNNSGTSTPTTMAGTPAPSTPTSTVKKSGKPRCSHPPCKAAAQPIVGDCGFCQKRFCGKHRMLESHACSGLEDAKQADRDRNTAKLEGERTVMLRGM